MNDPLELLRGVVAAFHVVGFVAWYLHEQHAPKTGPKWPFRRPVRPLNTLVQMGRIGRLDRP